MSVAIVVANDVVVFHWSGVRIMNGSHIERLSRGTQCGPHCLSQMLCNPFQMQQSHFAFGGMDIDIHRVGWHVQTQVHERFLVLFFRLGHDLLRSNKFRVRFFNAAFETGTTIH